MRYRGKIDRGIGLGLVTGLLVPLGIAVADKSWPMCVVSAFTWLLVFGFCFPQSYETGASELVIRAGFRKIRIPYDQLTTVRRTTDSRSALALSLDRILIEHQSGAVIIAPENQGAFLNDIQMHSPQLSKLGNDLVVSLL